MAGNTPGEEGRVNVLKDPNATKVPIVLLEITNIIKQLLYLTNIFEIIEKDRKEYIVVDKDALYRLIYSLNAFKAILRNTKIYNTLTRILADISEIKKKLTENLATTQKLQS